MTQEKFTVLAEKYADTVFRIALNFLKNKSDADDITQNTLIKLYKCDKEFESSEHARNWLIRVAVNECKRLSLSPWRSNVSSIEDMTAELKIEDEEQSGLLSTVMELPKKYRIVIYLFYFEGYSNDEIADILKSNPSTVRTQLQRARNILKLRLEEGFGYV